MDTEHYPTDTTIHNQTMSSLTSYPSGHHNTNGQMPMIQIPVKSATQYSEHGHSIWRIRPMSNHKGAFVLTFFDGLFRTVIAISTLGTSITFSYVLSRNSELPSSTIFSQDQIQDFLAISWLLFLIGLAFACLGSTFVTFFKDHWKADWDGLNGKTSQRSVQMYAMTATAVTGGLIVGAFVLLCLVVVGYSPVVGWVALGFTSAFGLCVVASICNQAPWPWRENHPISPRTHRGA